MSRPAMLNTIAVSRPAMLNTINVRRIWLGNVQFRLAITAAIILLCAIYANVFAATVTDENDVDVVVYGGTSAGVIAAYTARHYGKSVLLVEPGRHLGGMSSGGLGFTDIGNKYAITGLGLDFYRRVGRHYGVFESWTFEPHVAEDVFLQYIAEAGVRVAMSRRISRVNKNGTAISQIVLVDASGNSPAMIVNAKQFIDASYEGDLMAASGVAYTVGREPNSRYNETLNGVQLLSGHQMADQVDPYVVPGQPSSGLITGITGVGVAPNGAGDDKVQAYNFRMTLCQGANKLPIGKPMSYDKSRYELLLRQMAKQPWSGLNDGFIIVPLPNGKTDWNNKGGFSTDLIGGSWIYPEADYNKRAEIWRDHENYQKGLLYFLETDPRVPERLRREMATWGYCPDEFTDNGGWPSQLYVREARRMVGEYTMTEHDVRGETNVTDGVAMGAYTMDSHNTERVVVNGMVKNEGNVEAEVSAPYPISYRAITPRRDQVTNLLVPAALSASHIAYGSIRMEPVLMDLGQAAGVAAARAIDAGVGVQQLDAKALQSELKRNPLADGSTPEIVVDDRDAGRVRITGRWREVPVRGAYGPTALLSEGNAFSTVEFIPAITKAGLYSVRLYWPQITGIAQSARVIVHYADGEKSTIVDLRSPSNGLQGNVSSWFLLGTFRFDLSSRASITVESIENKEGTVVADAVMLTPVSAAAPHTN